MSLTLSLLREDLRTHLGVDESDLPDAAADRLLNRAWWPMAAQLRFNEKDAEYTFTTVAGTEAYSFPSDSDAVERVVIQESPNSKWEPVNKIDDWTMFGKEDDDNTGVPSYYSRRDNEFIFFPIPDDEYPVRVKYQRTLSDIESSGPGVPQEWHEVILWGAVSRGFFVLGDWTRGKDAQAQQAIFLATLSTQEERESFDRPMAGLTVLKRRYP